MKKAILTSLVAACTLLIGHEANATHAAGADISYVCLGGLQYQVTYTFYRDCGGVAAPGNVTFNTSSVNAGANFNTVSGAPTGPTQVVPVCPTATTTCSGGATPGRARYVYTVIINLPSQQTDWIFGVSVVARNASITTLVAPGGEALYVRATLNNTMQPCNNAPVFANNPAAFTYINQPFCFNNGAFDVDGDSLAYSLITPLTSNSTVVTYQPGYTATQPIASTPPVTFNTSTGDICMTPTMIEVGVIAVLVREYRFGILIGSVIRDIQVSVLGGADNLPSLDGINSTGLYSDTVVVGCPYTFVTTTADADGPQNLTLTSDVATSIPAATFISSGGSRPTGTFNWTPVPADATNYPHCFTATVRDNFCNVNGQQVKAFCLKVINLTATFTSSAPSCVGQPVNFYADWSIGNYSYLWSFGSGSVATYSMATSSNPVGVTYTTPGSKTVQLTITTPTGCVITNSQVITINPSPTASFTSTAPVCMSTAVAFTNTGSTGAGTTHDWNFGSGATPATSSAENPSGILYATPGTKTVTHTVTNNFGCVTSLTNTITINFSPVASFSSTAPACTGDSVDFQNTGTTGATYAWTFGAGSTPATSTTASPQNVVFGNAGVQTVTLVTTSGTCTDTSIQSFTITQSPAPAFTSTAPQCTTAAIIFTYTGTTGAGWTYSWDFGTGATPSSSSSQTPGSVMYSTSGTKTVSITVSNGNCSRTATSIILISATPDASFTSNAPKCTGAGVDFTNTGTSAGVVWAWTFGAASAPVTSTVQNPTGVVYSTAGIKTVSLVTTNLTTGCKDSTSMTITINQTPTASFVSNAPQCSNIGLNFTNTGSSGGAITYFWDFGSGANPPTSVAQNPSGVLYATAGTKTITLTTTDGSCSATSTQTITVNQSPVASFTSNTPACTGDPVNFINTGTSSGATYSWNFGAGAVPVSSTNQNPAAITYTLANMPTVVLVTTMGTCTDTSIQVIVINQTPNVSFTSTAPQCAGNTMNFTNTGSTGGNWMYSWSFGAGASPATSTSENPSGVIYATAGTKTVTLTISDGTCSNTLNQTITINALPSANAGPDTVICNNTSVQIGSAAVAGNTYSWFPPSTLSNSAIANPVASPIAPSTIYIVTVTNTSTGCVNTDSAVVSMLAPLAANAGTDVEICRYDTIQIGAALVTGQMYAWSPSTGLSSASSPNPMTSTTVTTTYTLSVTGPGCGPVTDEVTVTVHPLPIADAGPNDSITLGSSTQLTATGGVMYTWTPSTGLSNVSIYNPIANPTVTTMYYVTVTDMFGCVNSDSVTIYVITPTFWLPSAFTPNGDGENDILFAHGEGVSGFEIGIYNRWGELIFNTTDIKTGWDGKRQIGGQELPEGAYVYYVKGNLSNGDIVNETGLVNLIR